MNLLEEIEKENQLLQHTLIQLEESFETFKLELQSKEKEARELNQNNINALLKKANDKLKTIKTIPV